MTVEPLDTIAASVRTEAVVTRSRFIATLAPAADLAEAEALIAAVRAEFHDARHNCTAMVLGLDGSLQRSSDDGEPSGTAGAPMLAVLRGAGLSDVVAVVTRYFGGTLLGAGGLVRAYGSATGAAVELASRVPRRLFTVFAVRAAHEDAGRLEHRMRTWAEAHGGLVEAGRYGSTGAEFRVLVPAGAQGELRALLAEAGTASELKDLGDAVREVAAGNGHPVTGRDRHPGTPG